MCPEGLKSVLIIHTVEAFSMSHLALGRPIEQSVSNTFCEWVQYLQWFDWCALELPGSGKFWGKLSVNAFLPAKGFRSTIMIAPSEIQKQIL